MHQKWENIKESWGFKEFYFFAIALILAFGTLQTTGTLLQTDRPVVSVVSCSMYPKLHVGDILILKGTPTEEIQEGDVIVYSVPERIDITISGKSYTLEKNGESGSDMAGTSVGKIRLEQVLINDDRNKDQAIITVDGEQHRIREGGALTIDGQTLRADYITYMDIPVVHRVIEKNPGGLKTWGDNNNQQLEFEGKKSAVSIDQVYGQVLFKIPRIGGLKLLAMDIVGFQGDKPLIIDNYPSCHVRVPLDQRPY